MYKEKFYLWLKNEKKIHGKSLKRKQMSYNSLESKYNIFEESDTKKLLKLGVDNYDIKMYCDFLTESKLNKDDSCMSKISDFDISKTNILEQNIDNEVNISLFDYIEIQTQKANNSICKKNNMCTNSIPKKVQPAKLIMDIVIGQCSDINNNINRPMASYVSYDDNTKKWIRNQNSMHYSNLSITQYSTVSAFNGDTEVISMSINDTINESSTNVEDKYNKINGKSICLIPDNLGYFNDTVKIQLKSVGNDIIQIPRSIAAVYTYDLKNHLQIGEEFVCYDLDTKETCKTVIKIEEDAETGEKIFCRMPRQKIKNLSFEAIAKKYLEMYESKYCIKLDKIKKAIIETRDINKLVYDRKNILVKNGNEFATIKYDKSIVENILNQALIDIQKEIGNAKEKMVLLNIYDEQNRFIASKDLINGCIKIFEKIQSDETIWKEYLPELSLQVIKNGQFDSLKLIDKKAPPIEIKNSFMDDEIEIQIDDGEFTFPAEKDCIYLPLEREEFGEIQRDIFAKFSDEKILPLSQPIKVDLKLKYRYGNADSYMLIATPRNNEFKPLRSQWDDHKMDNDKYPEFMDDQGKFDDNDLDNMNTSLEEIKYKCINISTDKRVLGITKKKNFFMHTQLLDNLSMNLYKRFNNITSKEMKNPEIIKKLVEQYKNGIFAVLSDFYLCENSDNFLLYALSDCSEQQIENFYLDVKNFLSNSGILINKKIEIFDKLVEENDMQNIIFASRTISNPKNGVTNIICNTIKEGCRQNHIREYTKILRNIGAICWYDSEWIKNIYKEDLESIKIIIKTINRYLEECNESYIADERYNPKETRDILEVLLSVCRLKELEQSVLDVNDSLTKDIINKIITINSILNKYDKQMDTRVKADLNKGELEKTFDICFMIIQCLTGNEKLTLLSFEEE